MFTKKRIVLAIVLMLISISLAQGVRSYFHSQTAAAIPRPAHETPGDVHHPVSLGAVGASDHPQQLANAAQPDSLALLHDQPESWPGQDGCGVPCAGGNFIALDDHSGFFIPGPASNAGHAPAGNGMPHTNGAAEPGTENAQRGSTGSNPPPGGNAPAGGSDIPQPGGKAGPNTDADRGPTSPGSPPQPEYLADPADNPPAADKPSPSPFMPPNPILPDSPDTAAPLVAAPLDRTSVHSVPEPASLALIIAGMLGMAWLRKRA